MLEQCHAASRVAHKRGRRTKKKYVIFVQVLLEVIPMIQNEIVFATIHTISFVRHDTDAHLCGWAFKASAQFGAEVVREVLKCVDDDRR
jgi:hypothetical protein